MNQPERTDLKIDEAAIFRRMHALEQNEDPTRVREILAKARELKGLNTSDVSELISLKDPELLAELFTTARNVKESIYGPRIVLFAPLYISNLCSNDCLYCGFRTANKDITRRALSREEIAEETKIIVEQGHKRILLVSGENYRSEGLSYVLNAIETVYQVRSGRGEIRRVNVNIAPLTLEEFKLLKSAGIGTYQLFQETYHGKTYATMHPVGPKSNYTWRVSAFDRAMQAGIDDVGLGFLLGLYDWRFEVLALLQHVEHLERSFGVGPHTISVPRMEPTGGSDIAANPPHPVSDDDFQKLVAILRIAVPYTGIIMSTRENAAIRRATLALGVSQISAGSRTNPGGYADGIRDENAQFQLGDHRNLDEVIRDLAIMGYIPSFCTACYRLGRTGRDFMEVAKPGDIKYRCDPNALSTFLEYLIDYASPATRLAGEKLIVSRLDHMDAHLRATASKMLEQVRGGRRDVYV
ncbi:MAG: [FeFe] hydrogenase H-cluster radical SAM maturase HydG [Syntrophobacteraceae bacterium]